jgi:hypothetical protein
MNKEFKHWLQNQTFTYIYNFNYEKNNNGWKIIQEEYNSSTDWNWEEIIDVKWFV